MPVTGSPGKLAVVVLYIRLRRFEPVASEMQIPCQHRRPDAQQAYERLSQLSGEEFDREFAKLMVEDHQTHIEKFEKQANGDDSAVAEHAEDTLPVLDEHLELAQSIDEGPRG